MRSQIVQMFGGIAYGQIDQINGIVYDRRTFIADAIGICVRWLGAGRIADVCLFRFDLFQNDNYVGVHCDRFDNIAASQVIIGHGQVVQRVKMVGQQVVAILIFSWYVSYGVQAVFCFDLKMQRGRFCIGRFYMYWVS